MEIGAKLRQARIAAGLTQEQTAEALGVSRQSISNWENEKNYPDIVSVVRLSDLYAVSLDALLKEEAPMSDYLDYLEESTNTVRSRREQSLLILLCVYLGIWAVSVLFFWLLTGPDDAMGYGIVFLWLVLPVAAFVISLLIGRGGYGGRTADVPERPPVHDLPLRYHPPGGALPRRHRHCGAGSGVRPGHCRQGRR